MKLLDNVKWLILQLKLLYTGVSITNPGYKFHKNHKPSEELEACEEAEDCALSHN